VTDKSAPRLISETTYGNGGYTHQGWVDPDQRFFYLGDELDEIRYGNNTRTLVFDMSDLDNPVLHYTYDGVTAAIDHNGYVKDDIFLILPIKTCKRLVFSILTLKITTLALMGFGMCILFLIAE